MVAGKVNVFSIAGWNEDTKHISNIDLEVLARKFLGGVNFKVVRAKTRITA